MAYDATDFVVTEVVAPVRDPKSITDPRERVAYLRDFLRTLPPERFDMADCGAGVWEDPECGSPACMGGWARTLFYPPSALYRSLRDVGVERLGLDGDQAATLFYGAGSATTPAQAVAVLDHYLVTGKIDWAVA